MGIHQQQTGSGAGKDRAPVAADLRSPALQQALKGSEATPDGRPTSIPEARAGIPETRPRTMTLRAGSSSAATPAAVATEAAGGATLSAGVDHHSPPSSPLKGRRGSGSFAGTPAGSLTSLKGAPPSSTGPISLPVGRVTRTTSLAASQGTTGSLSAVLRQAGPHMGSREIKEQPGGGAEGAGTEGHTMTVQRTPVVSKSRVPAALYQQLSSEEGAHTSVQGGPVNSSRKDTQLSPGQHAGRGQHGQPATAGNNRPAGLPPSATLPPATAAAGQQPGAVPEGQSKQQQGEAGKTSGPGTEKHSKQQQGKKGGGSTSPAPPGEQKGKKPATAAAGAKPPVAKQQSKGRPVGAAAPPQAHATEIAAVNAMLRRRRSAGHQATPVPKGMEGQAMVGHRVCVYWPLEKRFFKGKVASYTPGQDKGYRIKYDDGDQENVSLSKEDWQLASDDEAPIPDLVLARALAMQDAMENSEGISGSRGGRQDSAGRYSRGTPPASGAAGTTGASTGATPAGAAVPKARKPEVKGEGSAAAAAQKLGGGSKSKSGAAGSGAKKAAAPARPGGEAGDAAKPASAALGASKAGKGRASAPSGPGQQRLQQLQGGMQEAAAAGAAGGAGAQPVNAASAPELGAPSGGRSGSGGGAGDGSKGAAARPAVLVLPAGGGPAGMTGPMGPISPPPTSPISPPGLLPPSPAGHAASPAGAVRRAAGSNTLSYNQMQSPTLAGYEMPSPLYAGQMGGTGGGGTAQGSGLMRAGTCSSPAEKSGSGSGGSGGTKRKSSDEGGTPSLKLPGSPQRSARLPTGSMLITSAGVGLVPPVPSPVRPAALALPDTTGHNNTQGHLQAASPSKLSPNRKSARPSPKRQKAANAAQQAAGVTPRKGTAAGTGGGVGGSDAAATSSPGQPLRQQVHTTPGGPDEGGGAAAEGGAGGVVRRTSTTTTATTTNSQVTPRARGHTSSSAQHLNDPLGLPPGFPLPQGVWVVCNGLQGIFLTKDGRVACTCASCMHPDPVASTSSLGSVPLARKRQRQEAAPVEGPAGAGSAAGLPAPAASFSAGQGGSSVAQGGPGALGAGGSSSGVAAVSGVSDAGAGGAYDARGSHLKVRTAGATVTGPLQHHIHTRHGSPAAGGAPLQEGGSGTPTPTAAAVARRHSSGGAFGWHLSAEEGGSQQAGAAIHQAVPSGTPGGGTLGGVKRKYEGEDQLHAGGGGMHQAISQAAAAGYLEGGERSALRQVWTAPGFERHSGRGDSHGKWKMTIRLVMPPSHSGPTSFSLGQLLSDFRLPHHVPQHLRTGVLPAPDVEAAEREASDFLQALASVSHNARSVSPAIGGPAAASRQGTPSAGDTSDQQDLHTGMVTRRMSGGGNREVLALLQSSAPAGQPGLGLQYTPSRLVRSSSAVKTPPVSAQMGQALREKRLPDSAPPVTTGGRDVSPGPDEMAGQAAKKARTVKQEGEPTAAQASGDGAPAPDMSMMMSQPHHFGIPLPPQPMPPGATSARPTPPPPQPPPPPPPQSMNRAGSLLAPIPPPMPSLMSSPLRSANGTGFATGAGVGEGAAGGPLGTGELFLPFPTPASIPPAPPPPPASAAGRMMHAPSNTYTAGATQVPPMIPAAALQQQPRFDQQGQQAASGLQQHAMHRLSLQQVGGGSGVGMMGPDPNRAPVQQLYMPFEASARRDSYGVGSAAGRDVGGMPGSAHPPLPPQPPPPPLPLPTSFWPGAQGHSHSGGNHVAMTHARAHSAQLPLRNSSSFGLTDADLGGVQMNGTVSGGTPPGGGPAHLTSAGSLPLPPPPSQQQQQQGGQRNRQPSSVRIPQPPPMPSSTTTTERRARRPSTAGSGATSGLVAGGSHGSGRENGVMAPGSNAGTGAGGRGRAAAGRQRGSGGGSRGSAGGAADAPAGGGGAAAAWQAELHNRNHPEPPAVVTWGPAAPAADGDTASDEDERDRLLSLGALAALGPEGAAAATAEAALMNAPWWWQEQPEVVDRGPGYTVLQASQDPPVYHICTLLPGCRGPDEVQVHAWEEGRILIMTEPLDPWDAHVFGIEALTREIFLPSRIEASSACSQFGEGGRLLIRVVGSSTGSNGAAAAAGSRRAGSGSLLMNQMSSALP